MGVPDPFGLGRQVLDDTPWYVPGADNRRGTERSLGFCNPYGYEDDKVVVLGGTRNPDAEPYPWQCRNYAQGRYRMICANGHAGAVRLCYGHVWMIQHHHSRAKNGLCPRCAWPPRARELDERATHLMRQISDPRCWPDDRRRYAAALEDVRAELDELRTRGVITSGAPLRLEEVS
jgi:hypothetical protein